MEILETITTIPFELGIGDPSAMGWSTAVAYLVATVLCLLCAGRSRRIFGAKNSSLHRLLWAGLAAVMLFLGLNKQLDLQSWFTVVVKAVAWEQGWYENGQMLQVWFILGLSLASLVMIITFAWLVRRAWRQYWILLLGLLILARFILVRAASFYGVHLPELSRLTGGFRINWLLEFLGIVVVICAAALSLRHSTKERPVSAGESFEPV